MISTCTEMFVLVYITQEHQGTRRWTLLHMIKTKRSSRPLQVSEITHVHEHIQDCIIFYSNNRQLDISPSSICQHKFHQAKC